MKYILLKQRFFYTDPDTGNESILWGGIIINNQVDSRDYIAEFKANFKRYYNYYLKDPTVEFNDQIEDYNTSVAIYTKEGANSFYSYDQTRDVEVFIINTTTSMIVDNKGYFYYSIFALHYNTFLSKVEEGWTWSNNTNYYYRRNYIYTEPTEIVIRTSWETELDLDLNGDGDKVDLTSKEVLVYDGIDHLFTNWEVYEDRD